MRMEWDIKTRTRISTLFLSSTLVMSIIILWSFLSNASGLSFTFGLFPDADPIVSRIVFILILWVWIISTVLWIVSENIKSRRMNKLKDLIDALESSETAQYVKSNLPPYMLADSVDRSLLGAIYDLGGDYLSVCWRLYERALPGNPAQINNLLVKLYLLGLVDFDWEYETIVLTAMGIDAVHIPVSLFVTKMPPRIWEEVLTMKRAIRAGDWKSAVIGASRALEAAMKDQLYLAASSPETESNQLLKDLDIDATTLFDGIRTLADLGLVRRKGLEWHLFESIRHIRNPQIHHSGRPIEFELKDASNCDIYISLLLRSWYTV